MRKLAIAMMALPALSGFLWAAFDISWWTPFELYSTRGPVLSIMHMIIAFVGFAVLLESYRK